MSTIEKAVLEICLEKKISQEQLFKQLPWLKAAFQPRTKPEAK